MLGDLNADDFLCRVIAENTHSTVVNVDYRLAPEHKWPAQLDDCVKMYKWVCIARTPPSASFLAQTQKLTSYRF